jgi:hypothetical protein
MIRTVQDGIITNRASTCIPVRIVPDVHSSNRHATDQEASLDLTAVAAAADGIVIGMILRDLLRQKGRPERLRSAALLIVWIGVLITLLTSHGLSAEGQDIGLAIGAALVAIGAAILIVPSRAARRLLRR